MKSLVYFATFSMSDALGKKGIIGAEFAAAQSDMAKFRNKLVHDYNTIDDNKVIEYARSAPDVFRAFGKAFFNLS